MSIQSKRFIGRFAIIPATVVSYLLSVLVFAWVGSAGLEYAQRHHYSTFIGLVGAALFPAGIVLMTMTPVAVFFGIEEWAKRATPKSRRYYPPSRHKIPPHPRGFLFHNLIHTKCPPHTNGNNVTIVT